MVLEIMPTALDLPNQFRMGSGALADAKKAGPRLMLVQEVEHEWRHLGIRPVVEGKCHFPALGRLARQARDIWAEKPRAGEHACDSQHEMVGSNRAEPPRPAPRDHHQPG
jgi:hypothetical protein